MCGVQKGSVSVKRTFKGTVVAINPTETSGYAGGVYAVNLHVAPSEMGEVDLDTVFHARRDIVGELGLLVGKHNAVSITVSTDSESADAGDTVRWIITDGNDPNHCADGEFGVEVNGKAYIYYKYSDATTSDAAYRQIRKREFGETIRVERNSGPSQSDVIGAAVDLLRRAQARLLTDGAGELLAGEIGAYIARVAGPRDDDEREEDAGS